MLVNWNTVSPTLIQHRHKASDVTIGEQTSLLVPGINEIPDLLIDHPQVMAYADNGIMQIVEISGVKSPDKVLKRLAEKFGSQVVAGIEVPLEARPTEKVVAIVQGCFDARTLEYIKGRDERAPVQISIQEQYKVMEEQVKPTVNYAPPLPDDLPGAAQLKQTLGAIET